MHKRPSHIVLGGAFALILMLSVAVAGYAQTLQQKIEFYLDGKVGTEMVKKGNYTISFPDADQGTLEIKVGKKVITAQFTRRPLTAEADADRITYRDAGDGSRAISTITPRGRKFTLVLQ
jgi:hypothetical protein